MQIDDFIKNFEESIEGLEPGSVRPETVFRELPQWDSLAVLTTLAMIDAEYEVSVSANELAECGTIQELFERIRERTTGDRN